MGKWKWKWNWLVWGSGEVYLSEKMILQGENER